jgi:hypothetical protein
MWLTAVPNIRLTKLHGGTSSTQYLVAKQFQNTKRHNLKSTAAILCKSNDFYQNICGSIEVCFWSYRADKMFNQKLFYRNNLTFLSHSRNKQACSRARYIAATLCRVSHITWTQLRPFVHWLHSKFHIKIYISVHFNSNKCNHIAAEQIKWTFWKVERCDALRAGETCWQQYRKAEEAYITNQF